MPAISTFLIPNTRNYIHCNYFCLFSRFVQHLFHVFNPSECAQPQIGRSFKEPPAVRLQLTPCVICCCFSCSPAAAAKSLQSCPTPCNPIDGSPPGSPVPGILRARTLEWAAISFSNFSRSVLSNSFMTPWTVAHKAPLSWNSPGKNTGVGCHALIQGIFPTQGSNPFILHW